MPLRSAAAPAVVQLADSGEATGVVRRTTADATPGRWAPCSVRVVHASECGPGIATRKGHSETAAIPCLRTDVQVSALARVTSGQIARWLGSSRQFASMLKCRVRRVSTIVRGLAVTRANVARMLTVNASEGSR